MGAPLIWLLLLGAGWRVDGSGHADAIPPQDWTPAWTTTLPGGSHASPVPGGDLLFVTVEPTTLVALDASTGEVRWRYDHPAVDALPDALAAEVRPRLAALPALEAELPEVRSTYVRTLRDARRADSTVTAAEVEAASTALDALESRIDALAPYRTVKQDDIGFAAATPASDAGAVYALFGNGVLVAHAHDGTLRWQQWLGRTSAVKWGFTGGDAASPQLHDGVLVVPWAQLRGIDPTTGATKWVGPDYPHYGTPTLARVGGLAVAITPAGQIVDVQTGEVVGDGLPELFYLSPAAEGSTLWTVGGDGDANATTPNLATRWSLTRTDGRVTATQAWRVELETRDRFYATPVHEEGRLYAITRRGDLHVLDASSGALLHRGLVEGLPGEVLGNLTVADGRLFVPSDRGGVGVVSLVPPFARLGIHEVGPTMSTPAMAAARVWLRSRDHVRCIGC